MWLSSPARDEAIDSHNFGSGTHSWSIGGSHAQGRGLFADATPSDRRPVWCSGWKQEAHLDALIQRLQTVQLSGAFGCDRCRVPADRPGESSLNMDTLRAGSMLQLCDRRCSTLQKGRQQPCMAERHWAPYVGGTIWSISLGHPNASNMLANDAQGKHTTVSKVHGSALCGQNWHDWLT